jgi:hypothetical protein
VAYEIIGVTSADGNTWTLSFDGVGDGVIDMRKHPDGFAALPRQGRLALGAGEQGVRGQIGVILTVSDDAPLVPDGDAALFPYAGYFRLFRGVDEFVIFDCVRFPRSGRGRRSEDVGGAGTVEWLTLPRAYHAQDTPIRDLAFSPDARKLLTLPTTAGD